VCVWGRGDWCEGESLYYLGNENLIHAQSILATLGVQVWHCLLY
jgi:hypothetical protein